MENIYRSTASYDNNPELIRRYRAGDNDAGEELVNLNRERSGFGTVEEKLEAISAAEAAAKLISMLSEKHML